MGNSKKITKNVILTLQNFSEESNVKNDFFSAYPRLKKFCNMYLIGLFLVSFFLVLIYEKVEYDTFTFYASKIELNKAGYANSNLTFVQEYLPVGWTKIQFLWADASPIAKNLVNYLVAVTLLAAIWRWESELRLYLIFLLCSNEIFFIQSSGYKADGTIGALGMLLLLVNKHLDKRGKYFLMMILSMFILSIKWTGLLLVVPFWTYLLVRNLFKLDFKIPANKGKLAQRINLKNSIYVLIVYFFFQFLELSLYWKSFKNTGSLTPTQTFGVDETKFSFFNFINQFPQYLNKQAIETFEPLSNFLLTHGMNLDFLNQLTYGSKTHISSGADQTFGFGNIYTVFALFISILYLFSRDHNIRLFSIIAITGTCLSLAAYSDLTNFRYLTPFVMLSYYPLAHWLRNGMQKCRTRNFLAADNFAIALIIFGLFSTSYYTLFDWHRNLVSIPTMGSPISPLSGYKNVAVLSPIELQVNQRSSKVLFRGWSGYQLPFDYLESRGWGGDSQVLLIYDSQYFDQTNYSYPFLNALNQRNKKFELYDFSNRNLMLGVCLKSKATLNIVFGTNTTPKTTEIFGDPEYEYPDGSIAIYSSNSCIE